MAKLKLMAVGLCLVLFPGLRSIAGGQTQSTGSGVATAQASQSAATAQSESAELAAKRLDLKEGTKISADLAATVDAGTAKPGDQVVVSGVMRVRPGMKVNADYSSMDAQKTAAAGPAGD